jgi:hypothetical protein
MKTGWKDSEGGRRGANEKKEARRIEYQEQGSEW